MTGYESKKHMAQDKLDSMKDEAMKLALEALQFDGNIWHMDCKKDEAITAIKEALAQPAQEPQVCCGEYDTCLRACTPRGRHLAQPAQQEPVAWMKASDTEWSISFFEEDGYVPLYTTPPKEKNT